MQTIGIDLAKTVFQLHAVDADGATVVRKRLRRVEVLSFESGLAATTTLSTASVISPQQEHTEPSEHRQC